MKIVALVLVLCTLLTIVGCGAPQSWETTATPTQPTQLLDVDNAPKFSPEGSFYCTDMLVELAAQEGAQIYYTTDGTIPTRKSTLYTGEGIRIFRSRTNLLTAHTIKAKAYYPDGTESQVAVHTYFCMKKVQERFTTAIFSITGDPADLTEGPEGIFYGENYKLRGDKSERQVYLEAWDSKGDQILSQSCGVRICGGVSRGNPIKSMKLYARKRYSPDNGKFDIDLFGTPVEEGSGRIIAEYDKLVLRNGGNDYAFAHIRDELCQMLAKDAGFTDYESVVPAICFLNGKYYGLFWLHESYCDDYFKEKYPNPAAKGEFVVIEGSDMEKNTDPDGSKEIYAQQFNELYETYAYGDMTDDALYAQFCRQVDIENYLDYFAFNIYINNKDWPQNNFKCYRYCGSDVGKFDGVYDGKWRFLLHDTDYSFWMYKEHVVAADYNNLEEILTPGTLRYSPLFAALMKRGDCREYFRAKIAELAEGALSKENINSRLQVMHQSRYTEYTYYSKVPGSNTGNLIEQVNIIRSFANQRAEYILKFTDEVFADYE